MPNKIGARTQPCFTLLRIGKDFDDDPLYCTVPCMSSWNEVTMLGSYGDIQSS